MEQNFLGVDVFILFYFFSLAVGIWTGFDFNQDRPDSVDLMLAGRTRGILTIVPSVILSIITGYHFFALVGSVVNPEVGLLGSHSVITFGITLVLLGLLIICKMRKREYVTLIDLFEERYGKFAAFFALILILSEMCYMTLSLGKLMAIVSNIFGSYGLVLAISLPLFVTVYTTFGWLYSSTYIALVQFCGSLICMAVILSTVWTHRSMEDRSIGKSFHIWVGDYNNLYSVTYWDELLYLVLVIIPWQGTIQNGLAATSPRVAMASFIISGLICALYQIPMLLVGAVAATMDWTKVRNVEVLKRPFNTTSDRHILISSLFTLVESTYIPYFGVALLSGLSMCASANSAIAIGTLFSRNIYACLKKKRKSKNVTEQGIILVGRLAIFFSSVIAAIPAILVPGICEIILSIASRLLYNAVLPQTLLLLYNKKINSYGALSITVSTILYEILIPQSSSDAMLALSATQMLWYPKKLILMVSNTLILIIVSYLTDFLFRRKLIAERFDFLRCFIDEKEAGKRKRRRSSRKKSEAKNMK